METPSKKHALGWGAALITSIVACYFLFAWMPYSFGYGSTAIPLTEMLWALWNDYGDWQHGMIVPLIVAGLIYWRRDSLREVPIQGSNWGLIPLLISLVFFWAGYRADIQYVGFLCIQSILGSLVIWFLGWRFFKAILFPWAFLIFAWPFLFLDTMVAFPLRIVMSSVSYHFLNLIGIETLRSGTGLVSAPDFGRGLAAGQRFEVDIADPCSGIRSLFALTMITCVYGYVVLKETWKKWTLFLTAVPLAILGNFVRILMLTFGTLLFGSEFAVGSIGHPSLYHMASGFAVFIVALLGMVSLAGLLQKVKLPHRTGSWAESPQSERARSHS